MNYCNHCARQIPLTGPDLCNVCAAIANEPIKAEGLRCRCVTCEPQKPTANAEPQADTARALGVATRERQAALDLLGEVMAERDGWKAAHEKLVERIEAIERICQTGAQ